jgi:hypothetical protein
VQGLATAPSHPRPERRASVSGGLASDGRRVTPIWCPDECRVAIVHHSCTGGALIALLSTWNVERRPDHGWAACGCAEGRAGSPKAGSQH